MDISQTYHVNMTIDLPPPSFTHTLYLCYDLGGTHLLLGRNITKILLCPEETEFALVGQEGFGKQCASD